MTTPWRALTRATRQTAASYVQSSRSTWPKVPWESPSGPGRRPLRFIGVALDNLADASVYAVGIYAVGRSVRAKVGAARLSGRLLIGLSVMLLVEVIRRFLGAEEPVGPAMMVMAA